MSRDITDFKNTEAALKEYLLATSHDLRTPVHGVVTAATLLAAREGIAADPEAAFLVQAVDSSCSLMLGLIQNTLEMRNIAGVMQEEDGRADEPCGILPQHKNNRWLSLKPVPCALRDVFDKVLQTVRVGCGLLRGKLEWKNEADALPAVVLADVDRLNQILTSVLLYSLRHSPGDAPVVLTVRCVQPAEEGSATTADGDAELCVDVCDPARQLQTAEYERIFAPNYSAASTLDACGPPPSSSGLGLFVARRIARAMGGDVQAEGGGDCGACGGSVLRVQLPVRLVAAAAAGGGALDVALPSKRPLRAASMSHMRVAKQLHVDPQLPAEAAALRPRCLLVDDHEVRAAGTLPSLADRWLMRASVNARLLTLGARRARRLIHAAEPQACAAFAGEARLRGACCRYRTRSEDHRRVCADEPLHACR